MFPETDPTCLDDIKPDLLYTPMQIALLPEWGYSPWTVYRAKCFDGKWVRLPKHRRKYIRGKVLIDAMLFLFAPELP